MRQRLLSVRGFRSQRSLLAEQRDFDVAMRQAWRPPRAPPHAADLARSTTVLGGTSISDVVHELQRAGVLSDDAVEVRDGVEALETALAALEAPAAEAQHADVLADMLATTSAAPHTPRRPSKTVRDAFDWRQLAVSQQGVGVDGRPGTVLVGAPWDVSEHVRTRRKPSQTLLLRTAHQAARAAARGGVAAAADTSDAHRLTLAARRYQQHWRRLLAYERAHQEETLAAERKRPIDELVAEGTALDGLRAYWQTERHFGRRVGVFKLRGGRPLPPHSFVPGSVVDLAPSAAPRDWWVPRAARDPFAAMDEAENPTHVDNAAQNGAAAPRLPAEVIDVGATYLRLRFDDEHSIVDLGAHDTWRLDRGESRVVAARTEAALDALLYDADAVVRASTPQRRYALAGTPLRDILTGHGAAGPGLFADDCRIRSWYERYARERPLRLDGDPDLGLNASQTRAVAMMLRERVSLVQGPPGTGKTRTLVQTVALLKRHFQVPHPVLLAAHTNVAVDNLVEGCVRAGLRVVRAGSAAAARAPLAAHTLEAHVARHAGHAELQEAEAAMRAAQATRDRWEQALRDENTAAGRRELRTAKRAVSHLAGRCHVLRTRLYADILHRADVVCTTAIAAGSSQLSAIDFPIVLLDEGSMATEPIALIPIMKGCAQLALVGDHKQLPPVLYSSAARRGGLSTSLFERWMRSEALGSGASLHIPRTMLAEQFRMHPVLSHFPNAAFYDGVLLDAPATAHLAPYASVFAAGTAHAPEPLTFIAHAPGAASSALASPYHAAQADLVLELVCDLLTRNPALHGVDIGIVTPYEAQARLLQRLLAGSPDVLSEDALDILAVMDAARAAELRAVEVHTVDRFEGREKPVMVFSTVKASGGPLVGSATLRDALVEPSAAAVERLADVPAGRGGYVGFLADPRRMNVALTRAQRQLFVVGNLETLLCARLGDAGAENVERSDVQTIRAYARWLVSRGAVLTVQDVRDRQLGGW